MSDTMICEKFIHESSRYLFCQHNLFKSEQQESAIKKNITSSKLEKVREEKFEE